MIATSSTKGTALYVVTKHGLAHAMKLAQHLPSPTIFVSQRLALPELTPAQAAAFAVQAMPLPMGPRLQSTFSAFDCHVFVLSVGAVVRLIAPLLVDKKSDPAVVCVDDAGRFAICLCSGHVGRGNLYTAQVARWLGATAVITTASDVLGTLPVDILGRELGWELDDDDRNVTRNSGCVVNDEAVALIQECGEPNFWPLDKKLPANIHYHTHLDAINPQTFCALLICTDRLLEHSHHAHWEKAVIYRPKSLVLGLGCDRNTPPELVERGVLHTLARHHLSYKSVRGVATIDLKADEPALLALCEKYRWPLSTFRADELNALTNLPNPSDVVAKHVGTRGVAEPAALLAAQVSTLLVEKTVYTEANAGRSMTLAVARLAFPSRENLQ